MPAHHYRLRYTLYGALFGVLFPVMAVAIRLTQYGSEATLQMIGRDPLLWIIATAPFFLGSFAWLAGIRQDKLQQALQEVERERAATQARVDEAVAIIQRQEREAHRKDAEMLARSETARKDAEFAHQILSEFLANMSHELRTPMTSVLGFMEIVQARTNDDQTREYCDMALKSGYALLRILNDLLDLAHLEARRVSVVLDTADVRAVVRDVE
jgi:signal transduction histidine kinase